jgi:hypothetical protein
MLTHCELSAMACYRSNNLSLLKWPLLWVVGAMIAIFDVSAATAAPQIPSLVPRTVDSSPDYVCSWNIQGYYSSYTKGPKGQKDAVQESQLFGQGPYQNWLGQYPKVHGDLYFLMDEGWDLPKEDITVTPERFPTYAVPSQADSFRNLSNAVKQRGWRGLGLWMRSDTRTDDFWTERLSWMNASGIAYWKVDYGDSGRNEDWRHHLTDLGRKLAPNLTIETAMVPDCISWGDTYRTYDVDELISIPQTLPRVVKELQYTAVPPAKGLINCEDEVTMGAALGCTYGIMRHSFVGNLPSGRQDFAFTPLTRDLKHCMDEVDRAVRWHRIAPAFAVGSNAVNVSSDQLTDDWYFQKDESWDIGAGKHVSVSAPAEVTRGLPLPQVTLASGTIKPYVVASRNPNGAIAIATLGRTHCPSETDREWTTGEVADITLQAGKNSGPIGVFGRYHSLTLVFDQPIGKGKILAQDLASDTPQDITRDVRVSGHQVTLPGALIDKVGLSAATPGDKSEPGLVLVIRNR